MSNATQRAAGIRCEMQEAEKECHIYLYGVIRYDDAWWTQTVVSRINEAAEMGYCIYCHILSEGGSVIAGNAFFNALMMAAQKEGVEVTTINEGLAASIAAIFLQAGTTRKMCDNALLMLHNASSEGKDSPLAQKVTAQIVKMLVNRTGKDEATVKGWLEKETWFSAAEAKAAGLIDEIIEPIFNAKPDKPTGTMPEDVSKIRNQYMADTTNGAGGGTQPTEQEKIAALEARLKALEGAGKGADASAAPTDAQKLLMQMMNEGDTATQLEMLQTPFREAAALRAQVLEKEERIKDLEAERVDTLINSARRDGRIGTDTEADSMRKLAITNYDDVKAMLGMRKPVARPSEIIAQAMSLNERGTWTLKDWSEKDPKGLNELEKNQPRIFEKLVNEFSATASLK